MTEINTTYPARAGRITASRCADMMTRDRSRQPDSFGETARTYALELALQRLGYTPESVTTWQMEWGIEHEPAAREIYAENRGVNVEMPGYIAMNEEVGCTPDGVMSEGILEIKCPQWKNHAEFLMDPPGPTHQYWKQMQFQMMVTGADWCDFMTFHPDFPDGLKAKVHRINRDEDYIELIRQRIPLFLDIINDYIKRLTK